MKTITRTICVLCLTLFINIYSVAAQATIEVIPEELKPWMAWVLKDHEQKLCPSAWNQADNHFCKWPAYLDLDIQETQGNFTQTGSVFKKGWVYLAGDVNNWPREVKNNDQVVSVIQKGQKPAIYLDKGDYKISGHFNWETLPEKLFIPKSIGMVNLQVNSKPLPGSSRDAKGFLWLKKNQGLKTPKKQNTVSLKVFRKITDSIPQESFSLIRLSVTGMDREITIGPVVDINTLPLYISSPLPAKLEENGFLKLQVRAGQWDIHVRNRYLSQQNSFKLGSTQSPWPDEEVWSFEVQNALRRVDLSGAQVLDPTQTDMPQNWHQFPSYLMNVNSNLSLEEKHRGKAKNRGEHLSLQRKIWLDFDGKGLTVQDKMSGMVDQDWRLRAKPPMILGQADINGEPQLITILESEQSELLDSTMSSATALQLASSEPGVEIRNGHLNLTATSRLEDKTFSFPAIGWQRDVQNLNATLYLPPGWKLFHAMGVDKVSDAWLRDWNLLDLFSVLFISVAMIKLLGIGWGLIGFITLVLTYHEPGAPLWTWLAVLTTMALAKAVPQSRIKTALSWGYYSSLALLILLAIPFIGKQIQTALYPQLSRSDSIVQPYSRQPVMQNIMSEKGSSMEGRGLADSAIATLGAPVKKINRKLMQPFEEQEAELSNYDPNSKVQTGPGLPKWSWNMIRLDWQGPVTQDQDLSLWLLPAWLVSLLKYLQVILVMVLIYALVRAFKQSGFEYELFSDKKSKNKKSEQINSVMSALLLPLIFLLGMTAGIEKAHAAIPDQEMLTELKNYLLAPSSCFPDCADFSQSQLNIDDKQLTLRLSANALEQVAIPLPSTSSDLRLENILLDGEPAKAIRTDNQGRVWLLLEKGLHEIVMLGSVAQQTQFSLSFDYNLKPKVVVVDSSDWSVSGLLNNRLTGQSLQFNKQLSTTASSPVQKLMLSDMPTFVNYTRKLQLGLDWKIYHEITRIAPKNSAIHLTLPLLTGEKVLSPHIKVEDGQAKVQLGYGQNRVVWHSELPIQPKIKLEALSSTQLKETWALQAIPKWHIRFSGIPLIHENSQVGQWLPKWQPWGKEVLTIDIVKPEAISGNTLTIEETRYKAMPGLRQSDHSLDLKIKSSQGTQHTILLPENSTLKDVLLDNISQPISLEGRNLTLPIHPGEQNITVQWQNQGTLGVQYTPDKISLNSDATNNFTDVKLSKDRWVLYLKGPELGPVVQYWSVVLLMVILAVILGLSRYTPLAIWQWVLLGLGVTLSTPIAALAVVLWFVVMQVRGRYGSKLQLIHFQFLQGILVVLTLIFILAIINCISTGLLGNPQMQLASPISNLVHSNFGADNAYELNWYQDKVKNNLASVWIVSVPMFVYRILMLLWALWLAFSLIKWFQWGWQCFIKGGIWRTESAKDISASDSN